MVEHYIYQLWPHVNTLFIQDFIERICKYSSYNTERNKGNLWK